MDVDVLVIGAGRPHVCARPRPGAGDGGSCSSIHWNTIGERIRGVRRRTVQLHQLGRTRIDHYISAKPQGSASPLWPGSAGTLSWALWNATGSPITRREQGQLFSATRSSAGEGVIGLLRRMCDEPGVRPRVPMARSTHRAPRRRRFPAIGPDGAVQRRTSLGTFRCERRWSSPPGALPFRSWAATSFGYEASREQFASPSSARSRPSCR